jgi:tetratricopeptide (TPR) repeat protein
VRLFIARAQAVKPDFAIDNDNAPAVAEICHRLDGLPLAIELAAARVRMLPPEAMLHRLEKRLPLLAGGARDAPERQRTLRKTIAWSYDLLEPEEQRLFHRLAVVAGGCTLEAAEAVGNHDGALDVFSCLEGLCEHSLVRQEEDAAGEPRFSMLETIREYGLEQLEASGEAERTRDAHAAHFQALTEAMLPLIWDAEQAHTLDRLDGELDNLRAAFAWALARKETLLALNLGIHLEKLWDVRGYLREGRDWLERASALPMDGVPSGPRAQALSNAGSLAQAQGDLDGARRFQERALTIIKEVDTEGGQRGMAHILNRLGIIAYLQGDIERAVELQEDALGRFRDLDDKGAIATTLNNLGVNAEAQGDYARARALYQEALVLQREAADTQSIAIYLSNLGGIARLQGDVAAAVDYCHESLLLWRELQDRWNTVATWLEVGRLASLWGKHERAARLFASGEALAEAVGASLVPREEERSIYECDVCTIRAALGEMSFTAAWLAGQSLHLDDAIAEALALTEELAKEAPNA